MLSHFSHVQLFSTLWTVNHQAPLSLGFSRQEYWSGLPCPPPGSLPSPGIKPRSPVWQADSLPAAPPWKPSHCRSRFNNTRRKRVSCKLLCAVLAECLVCSVRLLGHGKFLFTQMDFLLLFLFLTSLTIVNSGDPKFPFSFFEQNEAKKRALCVYFERLPFLSPHSILLSCVITNL